MTRSIKKSSQSLPADVEMEERPLSTREERTAYTKLFTRLVYSLKFFICDRHGQQVPTLKVHFTPEDQFSLENMQLGDLFYERNGGLYSGDFLRVGGQILITGSLGVNFGGLQLSWSNDFDSFSENGSMCSFRTNLYFVKSGCPARGSAEELWSQETKNSWPANELEDYNNLKHQVHHFAIGDISQWHEWADNNGTPWHLEGHDVEVLNGLTGPDERNKTPRHNGSMLFPVIHDPASFLTRLHTKDGMGRFLIEDGLGRMDTSVTTGKVAGEAEDEFVGTGVATGLFVVNGSMGEVTYNTNEARDLYENSCKNTVNAVVVKVQCLITMLVSYCAVCQKVKEVMTIGKCGHQFCTECLAKWECKQAGNAHTCPLCRGVMEQLRRTNLGTRNMAKQLAASAAKVVQEREALAAEREASVCSLVAVMRRLCVPSFEKANLDALKTLIDRKRKREVQQDRYIGGIHDPQDEPGCRHNDPAHKGDSLYWRAGFNHDLSRVCGGGCNETVGEGERFVLCKYCREHSECMLCHSLK